MKVAFRWFLLAALNVLLVTGCGGSGGTATGGSGGGGTAAATVTGVAAAGAPLVGTVYLKDSSSPSKEVSATIAADGSFSLDVSGLTKPYLLKAVGTAGGTSYTLYSLVTDAGVANINPLSHLAILHATAGADLGNIYNALTPTGLQSIAAQLATALSDVQTLLQPLFAEFAVAGVNPITTPFAADHTGLDGLLDHVRLETSGTTLTIRNSATNAVIFTAQTNSILSGTVTVGNIPAATFSVTPATATIAAGATVNLTATINGVVTTDVVWNLIETAGGTVSSSGVYTAPSTAGTYHVQAFSKTDANKSNTATITVTGTTPPPTSTLGNSTLTFSVEATPQPIKYLVLLVTMPQGVTVSNSLALNGQLVDGVLVAKGSAVGSTFFNSRYVIGTSNVRIEMYNANGFSAGQIIDMYCNLPQGNTTIKPTDFTMQLVQAYADLYKTQPIAAVNTTNVLPTALARPNW